MRADNLAKDSEMKRSYDKYMSRVSSEKIPVYEPSMGAEELDNLTAVIKSNWISEGEFTRKFENKLSEICERNHALCFSNATSAMIIGMKSLGIGPGCDIIVPSFSHSADPNAISVTGANPIFADVELDTLCLSTKTIQQAITENTKGVLFISAYGNSEGIDDVEKFCIQNDLIMINDCAPALCGTYKNHSIASYGYFSILSFFADKTITTGEGGMLLTDDEELINECNIYKNDGRKERGVDLIERIGYNSRITEMQTAIGLAQLDKVENFVERKLAILELYREALSVLPEIELFKFTTKGKIVPHRVVVFVEDAKKLVTYLTENNIGARTLFMPMHSQPCYNFRGNFPASCELYAKGVELPSSPTLKNSEIDLICKKLRSFYDSKN